jgi:hypothetical protein
MNAKPTFTIRIILAVLLGLLTFPAPAPALMMGQVVTKQTQSHYGLKFALSAIKESSEAVVVQMTVPKEGKQILLQTGIETRSDASGATIISFQISPDLADKYHLNLFTEISHGYATYFSVELKGYVTGKKQ